MVTSYVKEESRKLKTYSKEEIRSLDAERWGSSPLFGDDGSLYFSNGLEFVKQVDSLVQERKDNAVLLEDFVTTDNLTLTAGAISGGATIASVTDINGDPAVRLTAGTSTTAVDIEIPIQNFTGTNPDGSDFDILGLNVYVPETSSVSSITVFVTKDPSYGLGDHVSRGFGMAEGAFNDASPPKGGWNWINIQKSELTTGTLDVSDPDNLFVMVRLQIAANSGSIDLSSLWWNIPEPSKEAHVVITFDDAYRSVITEAFPYMNARGIKGTVYMVGSLTDTGDFLTLEDLHTLYNAGWDICNHTYSHLNALSFTTPEQVRTYMADVARNDKFLADNGFHRGRKHFAYPNGEAVPGTHDVAIKKAGFKTARVINSSGSLTHHVIGNKNQWTIPARGVASTTLLSSMTVMLDNAEGTGALGNSGKTAISYFHKIEDQVGTLFWSPALFKQYIDRIYSDIQKGILKSKTISEWSDYTGL